MTNNINIDKIEIQDDLSEQHQGGIEVIIKLSNGRTRWCYFMTPTALKSCGDWIEGTKIPYHYGRYMIVVAENLTNELIHKALYSIAKRGDIFDCTMAI